MQFSATTTDEAGDTLTDRGVAWQSDNAAVATVNGSGFVSSHALGTAHVTATSEGASDSVAITVTVRGVTLQVTPCCSPSMALGGHQQFTATVANDPANAGVAWSVEDDYRGPLGDSAGTVSATTSASGVAITYTAPARAPNLWIGDINLVAQSLTDVFQVTAVRIVLTPP